MEQMPLPPYVGVFMPPESPTPPPSARTMKHLYATRSKGPCTPYMYLLPGVRMMGLSPHRSRSGDSSGELPDGEDGLGDFAAEEFFGHTPESAGAARRPKLPVEDDWSEHASDLEDEDFVPEDDDDRDDEDFEYREESDVEDEPLEQMIASSQRPLLPSGEPAPMLHEPKSAEPLPLAEPAFADDGGDGLPELYEDVEGYRGVAAPAMSAYAPMSHAKKHGFVHRTLHVVLVLAFLLLLSANIAALYPNVKAVYCQYRPCALDIAAVGAHTNMTAGDLQDIFAKVKKELSLSVDGTVRGIEQEQQALKQRASDLSQKEKELEGKLKKLQEDSARKEKDVDGRLKATEAGQKQLQADSARNEKDVDGRLKATEDGQKQLDQRISDDFNRKLEAAKASLLGEVDHRLSAAQSGTGGEASVSSEKLQVLVDERVKAQLTGTSVRQKDVDEALKKLKTELIALVNEKTKASVDMQQVDSAVKKLKSEVDARVDQNLKDGVKQKQVDDAIAKLKAQLSGTSVGQKDVDAAVKKVKTELIALVNQKMDEVAGSLEEQVRAARATLVNEAVTEATKSIDGMAKAALGRQLGEVEADVRKALDADLSRKLKDLEREVAKGIHVSVDEKLTALEASVRRDIPSAKDAVAHEKLFKDRMLAELDSKLKTMKADVVAEACGRALDDKIDRAVRKAGVKPGAGAAARALPEVPYDFALGSVGGKIIHSQTSSPLGRTLANRVTRSLPKGGLAEWAIDAFVHAGRCWAFAGSQGTLTIRLSEPIVASAITLDHIPEAAAVDIRSAPRRFRVYGRGRSRKESLLGEYEYSLEAGAQAIQTFEIEPNARGKPIDAIRVEFLSNHGHPEYTCVYRLRVHGARTE